MASSLRIVPLTGVIGAEIQGVNIAEPLDRDVVAELRQALLRHQVLVFRDRALTPQQQYDFTVNFGSITEGIIEAAKPPVPGMTVIHSTNARTLNDQWHTDQTSVEVPPMAGMLHAVQLPSVGGDTLFANMVAAYDALTEPMRDFLDGLTATHNTQLLTQRMAAENKTFARMSQNESVHPVVRVHPETGLKSLFVCEIYTARINELSEAESRSVLQFLIRHIQSTEFQMRLKWELHTSVLWDERSTIHYAMPDYKETRILHRLMVDGTRPVGTRGLARAA
jgi:taurine dioxygenase